MGLLGNLSRFMWFHSLSLESLHMVFPDCHLEWFNSFYGRFGLQEQVLQETKHEAASPCTKYPCNPGPSLMQLEKGTPQVHT